MRLLCRSHFCHYSRSASRRSLSSAKRGRRGGWVLAAVALAYSLYAGFPETAFLDGMLVLLWAVYRYYQLDATARGRFAAKVGAAGASGVLIALPILFPFAEYVSQGLRGFHAGIATRGLHAVSGAMLIFPYIFGPIFGFSGADASGELSYAWSNIGGYLSIAVVLLAALGVRGDRYSRALRVLLCGWILICIAKTFALPIITPLLNLLPPLDQIPIFRYAEPSWEFAAVVLAAYAINDWQHRRTSGPICIVTVTGLIGCLGLASVAMSSKIIGGLERTVPDYGFWLFGAVTWGFLMLTLVAVVLRGRRPAAWQRYQALFSSPTLPACSESRW